MSYGYYIPRGYHVPAYFSVGQGLFRVPFQGVIPVP